MPRWVEIAQGVFVRRHRGFDVNCGLVLGDDQAMLIDTRSWRSEAEDLRHSVADVTALPVRTVVNTHGHFDHCFGNEVFAGGSTIWGQKGCARELIEYGETQRSVMIQHLPEHAQDLLAVNITPPTALVDEEASLDVGDRLIRLLHHGRGHTDHDLVVSIDDAGVVFAGDLIEQSGPPSFDDSWPAEWPATVTRMLASGNSLFVPGHGTPLSRESATAQRDELQALADLLAALVQGNIDDRALVLRSPFPETTTSTALQRIRATAELAGKGNVGSA
jgi:glyoxylase-like metal-dependent hydrolase (beta-lactamase superfamily II)